MIRLVYLPKSRQFTELTLTMTANAVKSGGRIILVGENDAGIRYRRSTLEDIVGPVEASEAARHSVLYLARNERKNAMDGPRGLDPNLQYRAGRAITFDLQLAWGIQSRPPRFRHKISS